VSLRDKGAEPELSNTKCAPAAEGIGLSIECRSGTNWQISIT
jgi:hypothetical protein